MKTIRYIARHEAEVIQDGKRIDHATGRTNVLKMKDRHGLTRQTPNKPVKFELPSGFETK